MTAIAHQLPTLEGLKQTPIGRHPQPSSEEQNRISGGERLVFEDYYRISGGERLTHVRDTLLMPATEGGVGIASFDGNDCLLAYMTAGGIIASVSDAEYLPKAFSSIQAAEGMLPQAADEDSSGTWLVVLWHLFGHRRHRPKTGDGEED